MGKIWEVKWIGNDERQLENAAFLLVQAALKTGKYEMCFHKPHKMANAFAENSICKEKEKTEECDEVQSNYTILLEDSILLALDVAAELANAGILIMNTAKRPEEIKEILKDYQGDIYAVDAGKVCRESGGIYDPIMPMLGAAIKVTGLINEEKFLADMLTNLEHMYSNSNNIVNRNMKCLELAIDCVAGIKK